jgi:hypothetical protein
MCVIAIVMRHVASSFESFESFEFCELFAGPHCPTIMQISKKEFIMPIVTAGNKGKPTLRRIPAQPKAGPNAKKAAVKKAPQKPVKTSGPRAAASKKAPLVGAKAAKPRAKRASAEVTVEVRMGAGTDSAPSRRFARGLGAFSRIVARYMPTDPELGQSKMRSVDTPRTVAGFARAMSALTSAVPRQLRHQFLTDLRQGLDAAITDDPENAQQREPGESRAKSNAAVLAGLEQQANQQRVLDIAAGRLITGGEMSRRLGITMQSLSAALKAKRMFAVKGPRGMYYYPAFFADGKYDRGMLEEVSQALGDLPASSKWYFFTTERLSLDGRTPLEALTKGKRQPVLDAAHDYAGQ